MEKWIVDSTLLIMTLRVLALCGFTQNSHIYSRQVLQLLSTDSQADEVARSNSKNM